MVRVMATGVFDILHLGHVHFLRKAKSMGDELVVVIARASTAKDRHKEPIIPANLRLQMVEALKPVDRAVLGHEDDIYKTVEEIKPDIIALGHDQNFDIERVKAECKKRGFTVEVRRVEPLKQDLLGTRKIVEKIADKIRKDGIESIVYEQEPDGNAGGKSS